MPIFEQEKRIYENFPVSRSYGQYNYGKIEEKDALSKLSLTSQQRPETHLYTTVETGSLTKLDQGLEAMKRGYGSGLGSSFDIQYIYTNMGGDMETEGHWGGVGLSMYLIDGAYNPPNAEACDRGKNAYDLVFIDNIDTYGGNAIIYLYNMNSSTEYPVATVQSTANVSNQQAGYVGGFTHTVASACNGVTIHLNTGGNYTSGTLTLYKVV